LKENLQELLTGWYYVLAVHTLMNKQDGIPQQSDFIKSNMEWVLEAD
jgi:hypothetical protein